MPYTENRNKISTAIELCFYPLNKYNSARNAYLEELKKITKSPYNDMMQGQMRADAEKSLIAQAQAAYNDIHAQLEAIRPAAAELAGMLDIGSNFQNTLATVSGLGQNIPQESRSALIEPFKGEMQMLKMLKSAYEAKGLSTAYFDGLIFSPDSRIDELDADAYAIAMQPNDGAMRIFDFGRALEKFGESMGAAPKRKFSDVVNVSGAMDDWLRAAAGLGEADKS